MDRLYHWYTSGDNTQNNIPFLKMPRFLIIFLLLTISYGCYTPLRSISRHPEKYVNRRIKIKGYPQRWQPNDHGYYFIVLTNRYGRHPIIVYKQTGYIFFHTPVKASGYLREFTRDKQKLYILIDSTTPMKKVKKDTLVLRFRDTIPPDCHFIIQSNF